MGRGTKFGFDRRILLRRMESSGLSSSSDPDAIVHHLRSQYPDYARQKIIPFSHHVRTLLLQLQQSQALAEEDSPSPEASKVKRKKRRPHPDEEGSSLLDEDAVYEAPVEPQFDITRSMLRAHYERKSLGKQKKNLVLEEENAPAPQPVSQRLLGSAAAEEIDRKEHKVDETPGAVCGGAGRNEDLGEVENDDGPRFRDFGGIDSLINGLVRTVLIPLCHPEVPRTLGVRPVAGVLLHGPPGCGKTRLAHAIANETGLPFYTISAAEVVSGVSGESEGNIRQLFRKAYRTAPSIVFIDEIDAIASKRENMHKEMERRIVTQLMTCMDESQQMASSVDADSDSEASYKKPGYVLVIGATNRPDVLDPALRRPGRFDKEIVLGVPDENTRKEILKVLTRKVRVEGSLDFLKLARSTAGFVGADLTALVNEAGNRAMERVIDKKEAQFNNEEERDKCGNRWWKRPWKVNEIQNLCITMSDFEEATKLVQPSLKREGFSSIPDVKWEDVGGLLSLRKELERIVRYIRNPDIYKEVGVTSGKGFLLYGPPGCGKTLVAKALAHEAGANFIHVKGPELLSKYVGESELAVRTLFSRARTCSPCIIFFDEIDALTTKRGEEGGQVVERLVTQLLTELNGIDERHGVHVFGATNRIEAVDRAILRHGRLGNLVYVPIPGTEERIQILRALFRKKPLDADVDLDAIGRSEACENLSGADLAEVVEEAAMLAVEERTEVMEMTTVPLTCVIKSSHIEQALAKISPSVLVEGRNRYEILAREYMRT